MIQLAMIALNLSLDDTIIYLKQQLASLKAADPLPADIERCRTDTTRQKKVHAFLTESRNNFSSSRILMPFKLILGADTVARSEWGDRGGEFMVSATREQIDAFIGNCPDESVFHSWGQQSRDWKEVIVIPFYDLPGRVSALQFCHLKGDKPTPFHYRGINPGFHGDFYKRPGIGMFQAMEKSDPQLGDDLFVFADPVIALRSHIIKLKDGTGLSLPLVAFYPESKPASFLREHCPSRRLIFWSHQLDAQFFKHVQATDGWVADHRPTENMFHFLNRQTPQHWINHLRKVARRWEAVLEDHIANMPLVELTAFMLRLDWTDDILDRFIDGCASVTRERLDDIRTKGRQYKRISHNGYWVMDTDRGWQNSRHDEIISEVVFYLDKVIHYEDGRHFYQGKARYGACTLDFTAPVDQFDKRPLQWLREYFIKNNAGAPTYMSIWQKSSLLISQKFQSPKTVPGIDHCGWNERKAAFTFLDNIIRVGGEFEKHELPSPEPLLSVQLPLPSEFSADDVELLSESHYSTDLCWSVAGCILHDVLARVFRYDTGGLMLTGEGSENAIKIAMALGCPEWKLDIDHHQWPDNAYITRMEERACWPIVFPLKMSHTTNPRLWLRQPRHNSIVRCNWDSAHTHMLCSRWKYIDIQHHMLEQQVIQAMKRAIPAFLHALASRQMGLWYQPGVGRLSHTFSNISDWFKERGGNPDVLNRAYYLTRFDEDGLASNMFFEMLAFLYSEGRLASYRSECVPRRKLCPTILYLPDRPELIWIPKPGLNLALSGRQRQLTIDLNSVSTALADDGKLIDEREIDGTPGWVVQRAAWDAALKQRESKTRKFGVIR